MSRAKMVATGMMIYGSDYDDCLPLANNWQDAVYPYMKNMDLMKGFNYLLSGQNMTEISNPAQTVLGIISTEYGEAVAYVDGHVVWRDAKSSGNLLLNQPLSTDPRRPYLHNISPEDPLSSRP